MKFVGISCAVAWIASASSAEAAVTVLGPGPAALCFQAAQTGAGLAEGLKACGEALATNLTTQDKFATFINRGVIDYALKDQAGATRDFEAGIQLQPEKGDGYIDRGLVFASENRFAEAEKDLSKGIELGSDHVYLAHYNRAIIEEQRGDILAAYRDYQQALALEPEFKLAEEQLKRFRVVDGGGSERTAPTGAPKFLFE
jgi:tetratricopeptide (TPR) repeat protein